MERFVIDFACNGSAPKEVLLEHYQYSKGLFPSVESVPIHDRTLALVGGGPSVTIERLRKWNGDIWAVNQTASWLIKAGIPAWLISSDSHPIISGWTEGVEKALLASTCHPSIFDRLKGKDVRLFNVVSGLENEITGGPATACRVPLLALKLGYQSVTFFGCEGSFAERTHSTRNENRLHQMLVRANNKTYRTTPDYYMTTKYLAEIIPAFPDFLKEESGGMLRAMIQDPYWEVIGYSEALRDIIDPTSQEKICSI